MGGSSDKSLTEIPRERGVISDSADGGGAIQTMGRDTHEQVMNRSGGSSEGGGNDGGNGAGGGLAGPTDPFDPNNYKPKARAFAIKKAIESKIEFNDSAPDPGSDSFVGGWAKREKLFEQALAQSKHLPTRRQPIKKDIVDIREAEDGTVVFLQIGDEKAGLHHILDHREGKEPNLIWREMHMKKRVGEDMSSALVDQILLTAAEGPFEDDGTAVRDYILDENGKTKNQIEVCKSEVGNGFIVSACARKVKQ
ncbi:MAG: hypothetical protein AAF542_07300 [Pseudomonadota bacterium]